MMVLGIDSAGAGCGVCVWQDGRVLASAFEAMERGQDRRLVPLILEVMQKAGADFDTLDRIAVTRGPGSFTGLRIGIAAARGIGLAASKSVLGIDRFAIYPRLFPMKIYWLSWTRAARNCSAVSFPRRARQNRPQ